MGHEAREANRVDPDAVDGSAPHARDGLRVRPGPCLAPGRGHALSRGSGRSGWRVHLALVMELHDGEGLHERAASLQIVTC